MRYYTIIDDHHTIVAGNSATHALQRAGHDPATFDGTIETTAPAGNDQRAAQAHAEQQAADRGHCVRIFGRQ